MTALHNVALANMQAQAQAAGFLAVEVDTMVLDFTCPTHDAAIVAERVKGLHGWWEATTCSTGSSDCPFSCTADVTPVDGPFASAAQSA